jgi:hypothetical protein
MPACMTSWRRLSAPAAALVLAGCTGALKHEITVSPRLRELPVRSILLAAPAFPKKFRRKNPEDFVEMLPERQRLTGDRIAEIFESVFSASVLVDARWDPAPGAREWAAEIGESLAVGRVPLSVPPHPVPAEAVLFSGVVHFGAADRSTQVSFLWGGHKRFGKPKWEHAVAIQTLLVDPRTGAVLMDAVHEERETAETYQSAILDELTRRVAWTILAAMPVIQRPPPEPAPAP